jgi:transposase-like protein
MAKYPGSFIINEVGTRKDLANIYGVSERTIYRWLNKAAEESGLSPKISKKRHPRPETLINFKGTRKALAKKYNVTLPITEEVNKVLFENKDPKTALLDLMVRDKKMELSVGGEDLPEGWK